MALARRSMSRLSHAVLTAAEHHEPLLYHAEIVRIIDHATAGIRVLRLRAAEPWPVELEGNEPSSSNATPPPPPLPAFSYRAGQWVDFHIQGVPVIGGYSFISAPTVPPQLGSLIDTPALPCFDLAVKRARHPPAAWVHSHACSVGAGATHSPMTLGVRVGGSFTLGVLDNNSSINNSKHDGTAVTPAPEQLLFIAGGVGINPLYSMLLEIAASLAAGEDKYRRSLISFLWSVRSLADAFLLPELKALSGPNGPLAGRLHVTLCVTRSPSSSNSSSGTSASGTGLQLQMASTATKAHDGFTAGFEVRRGRITPQLLQEDFASTSSSSSSSSKQHVPSHHCFVCGPPAFTDFVTSALVTHCGYAGSGVDVHSEKWW